MEDNPLVSGWLVPLLQSLTTGALSGIAAWAILAVTDSDRRFALLIMAIVSILSWLAYKSRWESILAAFGGIELDSQPEPAPEPAAVDVVRVELIQDNGHRGSWIDLPLDDWQAVHVARLLTTGAQLSHAALSGRGKPLSRAEYEALRTVMLQRGLARWINTRARSRGLELTPAGRAVMKRIAQATSPADLHQG